MDDSRWLRGTFCRGPCDWDPGWSFPALGAAAGIRDYGRSAAQLHLVFTVPALVFSPIGEEIFFRGYLQYTLQRGAGHRIACDLQYGHEPDDFRLPLALGVIALAGPATAATRTPIPGVRRKAWSGGRAMPRLARSVVIVWRTLMHKVYRTAISSVWLTVRMRLSSRRFTWLITYGLGAALILVGLAFAEYRTFAFAVGAGGL